MAFSQNFDLILFLAKHSQNKKDGSNFIQYKDLLGVQKDNGNTTGLGIFYYYKEIPAMVLANQYIPWRIVNEARAIFHDVVPHPEGIYYLT